MSAAGLGACDLLVVGGGPRALYALADLEGELARVGAARPLIVAVVEPDTPGAGAVWDPRQGEHLRMNVDAGIVDATCPSVPLTFTQFSGGDERFPPRAQTGTYLAWAFRALADSRLLQIRHVPQRVTSLRRVGTSWECTGHRGSTVTAAQVLLTTGHAGGASLDHGALASPSSGPTAGSRVVVRGAALTAFDVVMDLTAARGGRWESAADAPSGLAYVPSGGEPASVTLVSRSGEPMLPKPVEVPQHVVAAVRARTATWEPGATPDDDWWEVLAGAAEAAAAAAGVRVAPEDLWERLDRSAGGAGPRGTGREAPDERGIADIARARGDADADPAWWWGRAWSAGYADVVRSLERAPRDPHTWPRWRRRAAALERWAFGPPLETHRRLVALREAGLLHVAREAPDDADAHVIDAFTRGPGVLDAPRPWGVDRESAAVGATAGDAARDPWPSLLAAGAVTVRPGERGVLTRPDAACEGRDGMVTPGLFALGRPTEDPVIGHDSLQRRLHGDSARWAASLARRHASAPAPTLDPRQEFAHD
ncbi:FAD/NAD(P)-binding protein [Demequina sp. NBRC 110055]|uniref:FAD/NAD(P)-binding protein n=1 Tax=Demequina sp. NBRC 110055 TaxID=1570344 RepID=UPI00118728E1|nr:FAD/NAD(P)-binding protein [Demequina sp. NBRC 110055]